jgi:hypothetical protein
MTASVPIIPRSRPMTAPATTMCHARYLARKAVKAQLQAAGYMVSQIEPSVIAAKANAYLDQHRDDLLAQAAMTIDSVPGLRKLAVQEAKERSRRPQVTTIGHRQRPWPASVSVVHNSGPER